jgi:hypothetical protein
LNSGRTEPIVVFADILGFADLVLELESRIGVIDYAYYSATGIEKLHEELGGTTEDPLTSAFICFHRLLDLHIEHLMRADPIESVVFSDAAYVAFRDPGTASEFAVRLMRDLIRFGVPARMGVSTGTFRAVRLATDVSEGLRRHSSQFLGTGVVRAYRAESCGLKGMRIFLHPDAQLTEDYPGELVSVADSAGYADRRIPVQRELNYLHPYPPWIPQENGAKRRSDYEALRAAVAEMGRHAPNAAQIHYEETLAALGRMDVVEMPQGWPNAF